MKCMSRILPLLVASFVFNAQVVEADVLAWAQELNALKSVQEIAEARLSENLVLAGRATAIAYGSSLVCHRSKNPPFKAAIISEAHRILAEAGASDRLWKAFRKDFDTAWKTAAKSCGDKSTPLLSKEEMRVGILSLYNVDDLEVIQRRRAALYSKIVNALKEAD